MHVRTRSHAGVAATGVAAIGIAAMAATPLTPGVQAELQQAVSREVKLAATVVPPGGLLTSFLHNQVIYCSAICGPLINTGVTAGVTTLQTPVAFVGALQSGNILKAIGITAASVTGPTNAALAAAIAADTTVAVPKASNAFEVAVISLLNVVPAAAGGLPAVGAALEAAREQTFLALNSPVGGPPLATPMPQGVVEVAALSAIRVGEAIIFPAFNDVLQATVGVPNAAAQELAATGDPVRAVAAGVNSAAGTVNAAVSVIANSVVDGVNNIRDAAGQSSQGNMLALTQKPSTTTTSVRTSLGSSAQPGPTPKHAGIDSAGSHPLHDVVSKVGKAARNVVKNSTSGGKHRSDSSKPKD
jgi:hypothetical protein